MTMTIGSPGKPRHTREPSALIPFEGTEEQSQATDWYGNGELACLLAESIVHSSLAVS